MKVNKTLLSIFIVFGVSKIIWESIFRVLING